MCCWPSVVDRSYTKYAFGPYKNILLRLQWCKSVGPIEPGVRLLFSLPPLGRWMVENAYFYESAVTRKNIFNRASFTVQNKFFSLSIFFTVLHSFFEEIYFTKQKLYFTWSRLPLETNYLNLRTYMYTITYLIMCTSYLMWQILFPNEICECVQDAEQSWITFTYNNYLVFLIQWHWFLKLYTIVYPIMLLRFCLYQYHSQ